MDEGQHLHKYAVMWVLALEFILAAGGIAVIFITVVITIIFTITVMNSTYTSAITAAEL
jgi:hypothetical protein